ncbi:hypothetical protein CW304_20360 [Bacillus sp. UFRGS-B20]|nr:hypothetical protein CW304_20360 [Bacillus sp. UFRGS-B20]
MTNCKYTLKFCSSFFKRKFHVVNKAQFYQRTSFRYIIKIFYVNKGSMSHIQSFIFKRQLVLKNSSSVINNIKGVLKINILRTPFYFLIFLIM